MLLVYRKLTWIWCDFNPIPCLQGVQRILEEITHAQEELCVHASVMKISMRLLRSHNGLIDGFNGFDNNLGSGFKDTTRTNYLAIL